MGKSCSRFDKKEEDYCLEILMLGLDGAGKTTILNYLDGNSDEIPAPTITPSFSAGTNLSKGLDGLSISIWGFQGTNDLDRSGVVLFGSLRCCFSLWIVLTRQGSRK